MSIIVMVPTRRRPQRALECLSWFRSTVRLPDTRIVFGIDDDDPDLETYLDILPPKDRRRDFRADDPGTIVLHGWETGDLTRATNGLWHRFARQADIVGTVNDDMLFRSEGWDAHITEALAEPGIAYGNDMLQGAALPTAPFISAAIPRALGWYFLPTLEHMYVDDVVKAIGIGIGRLHYRPEVVIEHMHPGAGKAEMDEGYARADASTQRDRVRFEEWRDGGQRLRDIERVRVTLGDPVMA